MSLLGNNMNNNNSANQMLNLLNNIDNPRNYVQSLISNNPQINAMYNQFKEGYANKNPKDIVFQLARQYGINENELNTLAKKFNLH